MAIDYNELILGEKTDALLRRLAINLAIIGFLVHLLACVLYKFEYLDLSDTNDFFDSYLDSLYTPFSIILAYEVYELIRAIPESFSNSIGKQFEVISLLVVRDIFKNLAEIDDSNVNAVDSDVVFIAVEALAFTILFATALYFRKMTHSSGDSSKRDPAIQRFIKQKQTLACALALVYVLVASYSFSSWTFGFIDGDNDLSRTVFFLDFFTWLIVSDIIILLSSYKHITDFLQLARNTGFVLSTVIIRVGIGTPGYTGAVLFILSAVLATSVLRLSMLDWENPTPEEE
ncbi:MAG: hypothetical protein VXY11_05470 [Candidatus Thermoplasmatota archaeon]|nr:hypothetical protein [Candidatus Thermoplasmatota archaeon]|tara:strand:+ start:609 stop:1472 length:864 start_codon:yes stop_codon:yes gene_type:complete